MLLDEINALPNAAGVYFFYDTYHNLVYIGKSINIKKRVKQHFLGKDRKSIKLQSFVKKITFELTGNELIALLHESDLIKKYQPIYNRAQRKTIFFYGLYIKTVNNYLSLSIQKIADNSNPIVSFSSLKEAKDALFRITDKYVLCQKVNNLYKSKSSCFAYQVKMCYGACIGAEPPEQYNVRVNKFLEENVLVKFTDFFVLPGRISTEKGLVYIQNGVYKGFGYCDIHTHAKDYLKFISYKANTKDTRRIIIRHLINQKV